MIEDVLKRIQTQVSTNLAAELTTEAARWAATDPLTLVTVASAQIHIEDVLTPSTEDVYPAIFLVPVAAEDAKPSFRIGVKSGAGVKDSTHRIDVRLAIVGQDPAEVAKRLFRTLRALEITLEKYLPVDGATTSALSINNAHVTGKRYFDKETNGSDFRQTAVIDLEVMERVMAYAGTT
mgnify:CR=1 FL=1